MWSVPHFKNYMFLASIWVAYNFPSIVISAKILGLKFLPYIADTWNFVLETGPSADDYIRDSRKSCCINISAIPGKYR